MSLAFAFAGSFRCTCAEGWHGHNCEQDTDDCVANGHLCGGGSACVDQRGGGGFTCNCRNTRFGGTYCNDSTTGANATGLTVASARAFFTARSHTLASDFLATNAAAAAAVLLGVLLLVHFCVDTGLKAEGAELDCARTAGDT